MTRVAVGRRGAQSADTHLIIDISRSHRGLIAEYRDAGHIIDEFNVRGIGKLLDGNQPSTADDVTDRHLVLSEGSGLVRAKQGHGAESFCRGGKGVVEVRNDGKE